MTTWHKFDCCFISALISGIKFIIFAVKLYYYSILYQAKLKPNLRLKNDIKKVSQANQFISSVSFKLWQIKNLKKHEN